MKALIQKRKLNLRTTLNFGKMKIDKEKFNKLKQLDRIEFRQKYKEIPDGSGMYSLINVAFFIAILGTILGAVFYNSGQVELLNLAELFLNISLILFVVGAMVSFVLLIHVKKKIEELEQEYFKVEVKK